ncbi:MAG: aldehyde dehydrogenase family protein, partial [Pirellulales bacterium]
MKTLTDHCRNIANRARQASLELIGASSTAKADCLRAAASQIRQDAEAILDANKRDLATAPDYGLTDAAVDRLTLDNSRIEGIASGVEAVAALPDPVGDVMEASSRPNGLLVKKIRVPLGVVFFIYESRPNVTADAAAVALASGNAIILRGGKEAAHSSARIVESIRSAIEQSGLPLDCVQLVDIPDREAVGS